MLLGPEVLKQRSTDLIDRIKHFIVRQADAGQDMGSKLQAAFRRLGDNVGGTKPQQPMRISGILRPRKILAFGQACRIIATV